MFVKSVRIHSLYNILQQTLGGNTLNKVHLGDRGNINLGRIKFHFYINSFKLEGKETYQTFQNRVPLLSVGNDYVL